ncbi:MAG: hypothetical protein HUU11_16415 [Anaerolineales bacterium]|nr:hypothetical protein [Anaerolineales bacterium]
MPAYNFQRQFVKPILEGNKPHTIRRRRKRPTKVGDVLYMYTGLRTKKARLFAEAVCIDVVPVTIYPFRGEVWMTVNDLPIWMDGLEMRRLARRDGFESVSDFFEFFERYKKECLDDFEIIWWKPSELTPHVVWMSPKTVGKIVTGAKAEMVIYDDPFALPERKTK